MIGYILLTHGPKPGSTNIRNHPASRQQVANLKAFVDAMNWVDVPVVFDYARTVPSLSALPNLEQSLERAREQSNTVMIDDFRRIFSNCPRERRVDLYSRLMGYGGFFRDIQTRKDIGDLGRNYVSMMLTTDPRRYLKIVTPPSPSRSLEERRDQTRNATQASVETRARSADQKAAGLQKLRESLEKEEGKVSLNRLAQAANDAGVKTTRGGKWTAANVGRTLKRLDTLEG
ncbi:hypothetical protein FGK63_08660 [Ruegeria sediminis]|uniref:Recombinase domain-containing protein n=1 Tax=Ruegeria sediminis TaxID=2583820 RepID=A0ABY2WYB4_9RHOB|nr:hypothetical protein [Ruegeria sediminis]TMV07533.1 hypothetical protein FGK63_08660 [Ruegeria sediminis]